MRERFVIEGLAGRKTLNGELPVRGAKNAALKALAASILFEDEVVLENMPKIEDVERTNELLRASGARVEHQGSRITILPPQRWNTRLEPSIAERIRASVVLTGPMLAREGSVEFPFPGGDVIGERPIDLFLEGYAAMGAAVKEKDGFFYIEAPKLRAAKFFFPFVSVTATEALMMAAVLAEGITTLENVAIEPEIVALENYLIDCGAQIEGAGTHTLTITGRNGKLLRAEGKIFTMPPDRIEAGSFIIIAALAGEDVVVSHCNPQDLSALMAILERAGVPATVGSDFVHIKNAPTADVFKAVSARTHEYPGLATDYQALISIFLTQCEGEATVRETIFDGRFRYAEELSKMGADITIMNPYRILVRGPRALHAASLESPDIRAGLAYIIAAMVASGTSVIDNAYTIDRGYERIEERLHNIGLSIRRELAQ